MSSEYRLDLHSAAGVKFAEVTDFLSLAYSRVCSAPGLLSFQLRGDHSAIPQLSNNSQVLVYRRNTALGLPWTADFWGLWRGQKRHYTDHDLFDASCPGLLTMLSWRVVAWPSGTANRSTFTSVAAETIMKDLVTYNATGSALASSGRSRDGAITGITVQADSARGNVQSRDYSWKNLLTSLQDMASIAVADFDLVKTGAQSFDFRYYPSQLGTDRTATVLFALDRGNMAEPEYDYDRTSEQTVALVGGQGQGSDRTVVVRTGQDYVSGTNDEEVFVNASSETTTAGLNAKGDAQLYSSRARQQFKFKVLQIPSCFYGIHYQLGDLVKAQYDTVNVTQKVTGVSLSLDQSDAEQIDVQMATLG